jgi:hypothetical protein
MGQSRTDPSPMRARPLLSIRLEGPDAVLGKIPAADVAQVLTAVEVALARAVSVALGRPSRRPGRKERLVAEAAHVALVAIEAGSVVPVLELPTIDEDEGEPTLGVSVAHVSEIAAEQLLDVVAGEIDGHPYVVEAIANLSNKLSLGRRYERVSFELGTNGRQRSARLDDDAAARLRERVRLDRLASKQGMLVGTLVEADFESFTARLRSPEGASIAVSFEPAMADDIHHALRTPATVEGLITYDPASQSARRIDLRRVMRGSQLAIHVDAEQFRRRRTFRQLQREQGKTGRFDVADLYDADSSEAELAAYDSAVRELSEV